MRSQLQQLIRAKLDAPRGPNRRYMGPVLFVPKPRVRTEHSAPLGRPNMTLEEKFWARVKKSISTPGCWLWPGAIYITHEGARVTARNWAMQQYGKSPIILFRDQRFVSACGQANCICPEHQKAALKHPGHATLTAASVAAIRADQRPYREIAEQYGIARSYVSMIRSGARRPEKVALLHPFGLGKTA